MAKVALLIGVGNYKHPDALKPLVSAPKDVAAMQRILLNPQMGEFTEVIPLIDPDPMEMQEAIETLYRDRDKNDLVLLFFSGHGIKDDGGKLYFSTRVTRKTPKGELVKSTAVPARFVQEIMGNSRSRRQVMILDCCFSGAFDPALNAKDDGSLDLQKQLGAEGRVVLTSSSSTEYSFEQQGSDLSIYTHFLVEGIETGAADRDNDGKVSVRELHEYATKKVQETAPKMNPKIIVLKDEGFDVVFAKAHITDPKLKYRKEAERYSMRGEIYPARRALLNTLRVRLGLTLEETQEIEDQVLQPFRDRLKHLEEYRSAFVAEVERQYPLTQETLNELKDLQEILGLREEDVTRVEQAVTAQVTSKLEAYQQKLQQYEQALTTAIQREFPFSQQTRQELGSLQQSLGLRDEDIARIEQPLVELAELKHQENLRQEADRQRQEQERAEYENRLRRYEEEFTTAIAAQYPIDPLVRDGLNKFQQSLELSDEDVARIEAPLVAPKETAYQQRLADEQRRKEAEHQLKLERQQKLEQQRQEQLKQEAVAKQRQAEEQERQRREAEELKRQKAEAERLRLEELEQQRRELASEKGIDYTKLRDLLQANQWKEADRETYLRMLEAVGRKDGDWIREEELQNFPCADLQTIDRLWVKYSNGHFGFSVQKKIWQECSSPTWDRFCVKVGWQNAATNAHVDYSKLKYDPKKSPTGELPRNYILDVEITGKREELMGFIRDSFVKLPASPGSRFSSLAQRLVDCNR